MKIFKTSLLLAGSTLAGIGFMLYPVRSLPAHDTAILNRVAEKIPQEIASIKALDVHALIRAAAQKHKVRTF